MARGRMISKSLSTSRKYSELFEIAPDLAEFCQAIFPLIVVHSDDMGRQAGDCFTIKQKICPASPRNMSDVESALSALECVRLIERYDTPDGPAIEVVKFREHQPGLKSRATQFPDPPARPARAASWHEKKSAPPAHDGTTFDFELKGIEGKRTEPKGRELKRTEGKGTEKITEQKIKAAAPPQTPGTPAKAAHGKPEDNYRQILAIVHKEILPTGVTDIGDLEEATKSRCAKLRIAYNSEVVRKAVESALAARKARRA